LTDSTACVSAKRARRISSAAYPDHGFLAEESGAHAGAAADGYQWIIDPLDGTTNFLHGFPQFAVSIALRYRNRIEQAVVYNPVSQDIYTASRGYCPARHWFAVS